MLLKEDHMKICDLFNEVLNELEREYVGANLEWGTLNTVKGRGITEEEKQRLHSYRVRMNDLLKECSPI